MIGENAQSMTDSSLHAKLQPKLKSPVNNVRLENGTYEQIVAHLGQEIEINALRDSEDVPMATMASTSSKNRNQLSEGNDTNIDAQCTYFTANDQTTRKNVIKRKKLEADDKNALTPQRQLTAIQM